MARSSPQVFWFRLNLTRFLGFFKIPSVFLVSLKPRPFSWFLQNLARFLGFFKTSPVFLVSSKPRPTIVVVTRRFFPDLSVCSFPRSLRPRFLPPQHCQHWSACRRDPSSPSFSLLRSHIADFTFIIALLYLFYPSRRHTFFFVCPRRGSVTG